MKKIAILGSGGFSKEVFFLIQEIGDFEVVGFIDIEEKADIKIGTRSFSVFTENNLSSIGSDVLLAIGTGDPALIGKITNKFKGEFVFPNLVHPSVIGNFSDIEMGVGNIITANCVFTTSIKIGDFNIFNLATTVGHDVVIGNGNVINPAVNISGGVQIGNNNLIGVNATILQYKTVGNNATVGASSLVTKDVADGVTVVGVPAIKITK